MINVENYVTLLNETWLEYLRKVSYFVKLDVIRLHINSIELTNEKDFYKISWTNPCEKI